MRAQQFGWLLGLAFATNALAQSNPLTRQQAIQSALASGPRGSVARTDTIAARAQLLSASVFPNPIASVSYSKSEPRFHTAVEIPFDYAIVRRTRIEAANAGLRAADYRVAAAEAVIALDADTTYTRALAARARLVLSQRNAQDADSLRRIAAAREAAGDASELDVMQASVYAGQQANAALSDSLVLISAILDLQAIIGLPMDRVAITLADTLAFPSDTAARTVMTTLPVAAAIAALEATDIAARLQHRSIWATPSLALGFEYYDQSAPGILPTIGITLPFPLFDKNRGGIALADADRARARAEVTLAETESRADIAHAQRELANAVGRVQRDRVILAGANDVATRSVTAYREGAYPLTSVLDAQRAARDIERDYIDDVAAAAVAAASVRVLTQTPPPLPK
jgi:cobalt-zinc-cadmium efflux system outer membrane protein